MCAHWCPLWLHNDNKCCVVSVNGITVRLGQDILQIFTILTIFKENNGQFSPKKSNHTMNASLEGTTSTHILYLSRRTGTCEKKDW